MPVTQAAQAYAAANSALQSALSNVDSGGGPNSAVIIADLEALQAAYPALEALAQKYQALGI